VSTGAAGLSLVAFGKIGGPICAVRGVRMTNGRVVGQLLSLIVKVTAESAFLNDGLRDSLGAFVQISKIGSFLIIILVP